MENLIKNEIRRYFKESKENWFEEIKDTYFEEPIIKFADAEDPLFEEYKKINPINDDIEDFGKLEKSEQMENLIEQMEAQTPDKSKALNLNKPEVQEVQELEKAPKKIRKNR